MTGNRFRTYLLSILFIAIISFPFINDRLHLIIDTASFENRRLSQKPAFDAEHLDPYPAAFENYYNDTFALRSRIINYFNIYNCVFLKKSTFPDKLIIGKNNWLYISGPDMDTYQGINSLTEKELADYKTELEARKNYLDSLNCRFYVMVAPCKANIYPEYIPFIYIRMGNKCWGEQLNEYMTRNSSVRMVDAFSAIRAEKDKGTLYCSDDNHWNSLGAFFAANAAVSKMAEDIPGLKPLDLDDFTIAIEPSGPGNLKLMMGNLDVFESIRWTPKPKRGLKAENVPLENYPLLGTTKPEEYGLAKEIKNSDKPKLLIFSDSFGGDVFAFISENFSRTVKVFYGWEYRLYKEIIELEKPDAVLLITHEPLMRNILKFKNPEPGQPKAHGG